MKILIGILIVLLLLSIIIIILKKKSQIDNKTQIDNNLNIIEEWSNSCGNNIYELTNKKTNKLESCLEYNGCYNYNSNIFKYKSPNLISFDKCYELAYNANEDNFAISNYDITTKLGECLYGKNNENLINNEICKSNYDMILDILNIKKQEELKLNEDIKLIETKKQEIINSLELNTNKNIEIKQIMNDLKQNFDNTSILTNQKLNEIYISEQNLKNELAKKNIELQQTNQSLNELNNLFEELYIKSSAIKIPCTFSEGMPILSPIPASSSNLLRKCSNNLNIIYKNKTSCPTNTSLIGLSWNGDRVFNKDPCELPENSIVYQCNPKSGQTRSIIYGNKDVFNKVCNDKNLEEFILQTPLINRFPGYIITDPQLIDLYEQYRIQHQQYLEEEYKLNDKKNNLLLIISQLETNIINNKNEYDTTTSNYLNNTYTYTNLNDIETKKLSANVLEYTALNDLLNNFNNSNQQNLINLKNLLLNKSNEINTLNIELNKYEKNKNFKYGNNLSIGYYKINKILPHKFNI
jgi:hypothetical protein